MSINPWETGAYQQYPNPFQINPPQILPQNQNPLLLSTRGIQPIELDGNLENGAPNWKVKSKKKRSPYDPTDLLYGLNVGMRGISEAFARDQALEYQNNNLANPLNILPFQDGASEGVQYGYEQFKKGGISPEKAREMLHNPPRGKKLTEKQRKYFGYLSNKQFGGDIDPQSLSEIENSRRVEHIGNKDFDSIPSYLYYMKAAQDGNQDGMDKAYSHIRGIRGDEVANTLKSLGNNIHTTNLNTASKRNINSEKNPQIRALYAMVNENPNIMDGFNFELPQNTAVAKFDLGGSQYRKAILDFIYSEDDWGSSNPKAVESNDAPSVDEVEEQIAPDNQDDLIYSMFANQEPQEPVNPYKQARENFNFKSSGKYGTSKIGPYGEQIASELSKDLGYAPKFNSIYRDPQQQAALVAQGVGVKNSFHLTGNAVDLKPQDWANLSAAQKSKYKSKYDVISHNNHVHLEPKGK